MAEINELDVRSEPDFELPSDEKLMGLFPFENKRKYQHEALQMIIGGFLSGYKHIILEAPAGFGKSAIAVALTKYYEAKGKSYIIVSSKFLQDQYLQELEAVTVKGRGNFTCVQNKKLSCETAQRMSRLVRCSHIPRPSKNPEKKRFVGTSAKRGKLYIEKEKQVCPYWKQKCAAMEHSSPLLNYEYFLYETQYVGDFGKRGLIVCDEAHNLESKLMRFIGFEIGQKELNFIGAGFPEKEFGIKEWVDILKEWTELFLEKIAKLEGDIDTLTPLDLEKLEGIRGKVEKIEFLISELDSDPDLWVAFIEENFFRGRLFKKVIFKPIDVRKWGDYIFSKGDNFLLQSATILNPKALCESLGITGDVLYLKVPSIFDPSNRLFYYKGVGSMTRANIENTMPKLLGEVERIIAKNPQEKGVIHTHNYSIMRKIANKININRIVFNQDSFSRDEVFNQFKNSKEPLVLVTPSAYEGVDFKGDECRWQVLCKVPYPSLGDPQVKKRVEKDREWYIWLTALKIVQTYGRGMRSPDDFCKTYILDSNFKSFYLNNKKFFPEWFQVAVRWDGA